MADSCRTCGAGRRTPDDYDVRHGHADWCPAISAWLASLDSYRRAAAEAETA